MARETVMTPTGPVTVLTGADAYAAMMLRIEECAAKGGKVAAERLAEEHKHMSTITKVTVQRAEGPNTADFSKHTFEGEDAEARANAYLREISATAPRTGGYDKTDVVVTLASGDEFKLRHDVKHFECDDSDTDVRRSLRDFFYYHLHPEEIPWVRATDNRSGKRDRTIKALADSLEGQREEFTRLLAVLDGDRCEHGMFFSGAGACPQCGGGAE
jgi:hypothetical protein